MTQTKSAPNKYGHSGTLSYIYTWNIFCLTFLDVMSIISHLLLASLILRYALFPVDIQCPDLRAFRTDALGAMKILTLRVCCGQ